MHPQRLQTQMQTHLLCGNYHFQNRWSRLGTKLPKIQIPIRPLAMKVMPMAWRQPRAEAHGPADFEGEDTGESYSLGVVS